MERKTESRFRIGGRPFVVAHRGDSSRHPENTLPAFEAAVRVGADMVELDVRLSADGVAVILHDPDVSRTTSGSGLVHELSVSALSELRTEGGPGGSVGIPLLADALRALGGRIGVNLEIKNLPSEPAFVPDGQPHVEAALAEMAAARFEGLVLVSSFNPRALDRSKELAPEIATGLLSTADVDPGAALAYVRDEGHDAVLPDFRAVLAGGGDFVEEAHAHGILVGTWTVDDAGTIARLFDLGVDAVATDRPEVAVRIRDGIDRES